MDLNLIGQADGKNHQESAARAAGSDGPEITNGGQSLPSPVRKKRAYHRRQPRSVAATVRQPASVSSPAPDHASRVIVMLDPKAFDRMLEQNEIPATEAVEFRRLNHN